MLRVENDRFRKFCGGRTPQILESCEAQSPLGEASQLLILETSGMLVRCTMLQPPSQTNQVRILGFQNLIFNKVIHMHSKHEIHWHNGYEKGV